MGSSQIPETCAAAHKISVSDADDDDSIKVERLQRAQWLRAAILGANDGLLSTTSLMLGVGAAKEDRRSMVLSGVAGALAGACSMAVGEFVSVATQRDIEKANVSRCGSEKGGQDLPGIRLHIGVTPASIKEETKLGELNSTVTLSQNLQCGKLVSDPIDKASPSMILESKLPPGMSPGRSLAMKVIKEYTKKRAGTLREDDKEEVLTDPYKAAVASGLAFLCGSCVPLVSAILVAHNVVRIVVIAVVASIALALFGSFGAYLGGSPIRISAARVLVGGWIAMAITYGLIKPFDSDHKGNNDKD